MNPPAPVSLTRREALVRAAALAGLSLTPAWIDRVLAAAAGPVAALPPARAAVLAAAAERILPRTDTPGALDVGVPAFLSRLLEGYVPPADRDIVFAGLDALETAALAAHGQSFTAVPAAAQDALIRTAAEAGGRFFPLLREYTLLGYFTAEKVGREVLHYDPVPGRWDPCVPLAEVGDRLWTR